DRAHRDLGGSNLVSTWLAARDEEKVVLKLPHGEAIDAGLGQRIVRERARLAPIVHPQIAHLLDAGWTEAGQPFIASQSVEGTAIDVWCHDRRLDVRTAVRAFRDAAQAVATIHTYNIVHGDIQPANVVVTREGTVKLLDAGLTRILAGAAHRRGGDL